MQHPSRTLARQRRRRPAGRRRGAANRCPRPGARGEGSPARCCATRWPNARPRSPSTVEHSGGRSGADDEELATPSTAAARNVVDAERHAVLDRLDQETGRPDGLAVGGLEPVLQALRAQQVDTLLLDGGVERPGTLWVGDSPSQVATDAERLRGLGSEPVAQVPVDAALLAAAAASGAAFEPLGGGRTGLVGKPVEDGVACCCATRW
jgi:hypothetical protein